MPFRIRRAPEQDPGGFDRGRITERKPVNFPGEGTQTTRYGPLLYWAWASTPEGGLIGEHPHQGFEIVSYVLKGRMEHRDSLGTWKSLLPGDVQVMQTNSGLTHSERFAAGEHTEMFQIWFDPDLRQTIRQQPHYADYRAEVFPWRPYNGYRIKHILGTQAPVRLVTDARFDDILVESGGEFVAQEEERFAILVAIEGESEVMQDDHSTKLTRGDAVYLDGTTPYRLRAVVQFRFAQIIVPQRVSYPLYPQY